MLTDTDPRAMEVWTELLQRMTPGEKLGLTIKMTEALFARWDTEIRVAFPEADDHEVLMQRASRHLSRDLMTPPTSGIRWLMTLWRASSKSRMSTWIWTTYDIGRRCAGCRMFWSLSRLDRIL